MFFLARKNLFQEKIRLFISVGGVAFSVVLIMVLAGLYRGWNDKMGQYIRAVPADLWVMQDGTEDMFHTPSVLPLEYENQIAELDGVQSVKPFSGRRVAFHTANSQDVSMYIVSYDSERQVGLPAAVVAGKSVPDRGEIIVDKIPAKIKGIKINDTLDIAGQKFKVVGLSERGDVVTFSFAFVKKEDAEAILRVPNSTNFFLVQLQEGAGPDQVIDNINSVLPVDAVTKQKFVDNNTKLIKETFLPVILVLLIIGTIVGTAVIGLTIFTSVVEKIREYGVLKAIGMNNRQLYGVVIKQALIAGLIGFSLGSLIALILQLTIGNLVPQFVSQINASDVLLIFGLTILMSAAASYMPIRRIAHVDPAEVFKA